MGQAVFYQGISALRSQLSHRSVIEFVAVFVTAYFKKSGNRFST
jgi:hypothetical protein